MRDKRPYKPRKPGAGRYDAAAILQEQMEAAVALYTNNSLQTIADSISQSHALMINQYRNQITEGEESLTGIGGIVYEC